MSAAQQKGSARNGPEDQSLSADRGQAGARLLRQMLDALVEHREAERDTAAEEKVAVLHTALVIRPPRPLWVMRMEAAAEDGVEQSLVASMVCIPRRCDFIRLGSRFRG